MSNQSLLVAVAQAEDTQDLLNHIAWTDVIKPRLEKKIKNFSLMLVSHMLGRKLPGDYTPEQIAGMVYGLQETILTIEQVLAQGAKALEDLEMSSGISLH